MKILVTGGAGFIGSHVVDQLLSAGHFVAVADSLSSGHRSNVPPAARLYEVDVTDAEGVGTVMTRERPEAVIHLAAQINVRVSIQDPGFDARQNILGSINVLRACARERVRRFVLASSGGAMYGEQGIIPTPETAPAVPTSPYGIAKLACEHYARYYGQEGTIQIVSLRLANVYGPRQDPRGEAGVVAIFIPRMLRGEQPVVFGDGRKTRDYVYVEDAAEAFVCSLECPPGTYNIGTGIETEVNALFRHLKRLTGFPGEADHGPAVYGEVTRSALDAGLAKDRLRWAPKVDLEAGLSRTVRYSRAGAVRQ